MSDTRIQLEAHSPRGGPLQPANPSNHLHDFLLFHLILTLPDVPDCQIVVEIQLLAKLLVQVLASSDKTQHSESKESNPRTWEAWGAGNQTLVKHSCKLMGCSMSSQKLIRVVTRAADGSLRTKDFDDFEKIMELHDQIGIDDCSTDLSLRGMPLFRGLIGPLAEGKTIVRYESPDVFESLTKEWSNAKTKRRRRRSSTPAAGTVPVPNVAISTPIGLPTVV